MTMHDGGTAYTLPITRALRRHMDRQGGDLTCGFVGEDDVPHGVPATRRLYANGDQFVALVCDEHASPFPAIDVERPREL